MVRRTLDQENRQKEADSATKAKVGMHLVHLVPKRRLGTGTRPTRSKSPREVAHGRVQGSRTLHSTAPPRPGRIAVPRQGPAGQRPRAAAPVLPPGDGDLSLPVPRLAGRPEKPVCSLRPGL